jgi:Replication-relaxation
VSGRARARRLAERLSERDIAILTSLRDFRLMTGAQLRRLHFPGDQLVTQSRKARAALARLVQLRVAVRLQRRVGGIRAGSEGHIYGLSGLGHAVLDLNAATPRRHRGVTQTKLAFQSHVLAVSELAVKLHERARAGHCHIEQLCAEPACWRWFSGLSGQRRILKPDAFVRLGVDDCEIAAFIEVDQDTESLPTITRKLGVYIDYWRSGQEQHTHGLFPRVWWLVPDHRRHEALSRTIRRLSTDVHALFSVVLTTHAVDLLTQLPTEGGAR